jgi:hypothetical protein
MIQGFLDQSGSFTYLNYNGNSSLNDTIVSDINESGEIVGLFFNVPESGTFTSLAAGLLFLALAQRRRLAFFLHQS